MKRLLVAVMLVSVPALAGDKGKPVTVKLPPLPPSSEDLIFADPAKAGWTSADPMGLPKGAQIALIGMEPLSTAPIVYMKVPGGYKLPAHWHTHIEYTAILAGKGNLTLDGKAHAVAPGNYWVTPSKVPHAFECDPGAECLLLVRRSGPADLNWVQPPK